MTADEKPVVCAEHADVSQVPFEAAAAIAAETYGPALSCPSAPPPALRRLQREDVSERHCMAAGHPAALSALSRSTVFARF
jgi:hypothetical protein